MNLSAVLAARWEALAGRERRLVMGAAVLIGAALLWWLALAPALATLRLADQQRDRLDAQLQQMQVMKAQALALQSLPKINSDDARRSLEDLLKRTLPGTAQMVVVGDRATVTLKGAPPDALAQWLVQARINARTVPAEVRLAKAANAKPGAPMAWDGTLVLNLPAR